ncbi:PREDICTED: F-box protein PP2-B15-like [Lupinus angustifolius]|uniref:F-box protein PP2-B15-like n=1 Tax=Lupinus angustifolius TaxID=3871 RepID=UPI00092EE832|nr:PREDICTED: F-box protein PP2-B15-like [Lupinus angustifolius]
MELLPNDCLEHILSFTCPQEVCKFSLISSIMHSMADSDVVWEKFLPLNYQEIVSRLVEPFSCSSSKKELFVTLCKPQLIDDGTKMFSIEKKTCKICYLLSAKELSIAWGDNPLCWSWKPVQGSRFLEAAELITVNWLEIEGKIRTQILTPNTLYGAYLIMNVSHRAYGLDFAPSEVSIVTENKVEKRKAYLYHKEENELKMETLFYGNRMETLRMVQDEEDNEGISYPSKREDGWMEIKIGEFFSGKGNEDVKMCLREVGHRLKGGLILEGIEIRPKNV